MQSHENVTNKLPCSIKGRQAVASNHLLADANLEKQSTFFFFFWGDDQLTRSRSGHAACSISSDLCGARGGHALPSLLIAGVELALPLADPLQNVAVVLD